MSAAVGWGGGGHWVGVRVGALGRGEGNDKMTRYRNAFGMTFQDLKYICEFIFPWFKNTRPNVSGSNIGMAGFLLNQKLYLNAFIKLHFHLSPWKLKCKIGHQIDMITTGMSIQYFNDSNTHQCITNTPIQIY